MTRIILAALSFLLVSRAANADELRFGSMRITWPESCTSQAGQRTISMDCAGGEHVIVSVVHSKSAASNDREHYEALAQDIADHVMASQAAENGQIIRPVSKKAANDIVIFSTASKDWQQLRESYFLQYAVGGSGGVVYFTIEGYGKTADQMPRFDAAFETARFE